MKSTAIRRRMSRIVARARQQLHKRQWPQCLTIGLRFQVPQQPVERHLVPGIIPPATEISNMAHPANIGRSRLARPLETFVNLHRKKHSLLSLAFFLQRRFDFLSSTSRLSIARCSSFAMLPPCALLGDGQFKAVVPATANRPVSRLRARFSALLSSPADTAGRSYLARP